MLLTIFARVGVHRDSSTTWEVDDNHPDKCRGIAGHIWFEESFHYRTSTSDWNDNMASSEKTKFAKEFSATIEEVEKCKQKPGTIVGTLLRVRGRKWGVIILDSNERIADSKCQEHRKLIEEYANCISRVIQESEYDGN